MKATTQKDKYAFDYSEETTLETWLLYWLDAYVKPVSKPSGYEHYRDNCVKHIIPAIGDIQLGNLTPRVLQRFFNEQARTGNLRAGCCAETGHCRGADAQQSRAAHCDQVGKKPTGTDHDQRSPAHLGALSVRALWP